ncbi:MAG: phosphatidate cytidylyltransferase [Lachnospiraceae bacterium]|nr:phosphatidate cytidylyltransferase [Lachnospiraceae bacterium]
MDEKKKSKFLIRLASSIVLVAIVVSVGILGSSNVMLAFTGFISLVGMMEIMRVFKIHKSVIAPLGYIGVIALYACICCDRPDMIIFVAVAYLLLIMMIFVITFPKFSSNQMMGLFFGLFYVALMISYMYRIRLLENGKYYFFMVFLTAWGSDVFAYCVGLLIGKHKAFPKLSPKKTIEGCVGGVVGGALMPFLYTLILTNMGVLSFKSEYVLLMGGLAAILSQCGDLAASAIKRNYDVKDYGHLIPGHGGILDRFDSIIFVAPVMYYLLTILI